MIKHLLISFLFIIGSFEAQAQLDCEYSISSASITVGNVLKNLENKCGVSFSYLSESIPIDSMVSIHVENKDIPYILKSVLGKDLVIRQIGNTVLLKKVKTHKKDINKVEKIKIRGVISDKNTNKKLKDVTVFTVEDLKPVLTDSAGNFELEVAQEPQTIVVKRQDYIDTLIVVTPVKDTTKIQRIRIAKIPELKQKIDSLLQKFDSLPLIKWLGKTDFQKHALNFGNSLINDRSIQVSLVPGLSSNGKMNSASSNTFSLNVLGGYSGEVKGLEVGGLVNIVKQNVNGLQICGVSNIVGGKLNGIQISGLTNITLNEIQGSQISGLINVSRNEMNGTQIAGFTNISSGSMKGIQASGFLNIGSNITGSQFSGFTNIGYKDSKGTQIAGFYNHLNGKMKGVQISGFINYAKQLTGIQIGVINFVSDTIKGLPIGLLSIAPKGYMRFQLDYSPTIPVKASVFSGVKAFHNILNVGMLKPNEYTIGYGIGTAFPLHKYLDVNFKLVGNQFVDNFNFQNIDLNCLLRLSSGLSVKIGDRFEVFGLYNINSHIHKNLQPLGVDLFQTVEGDFNIDGFQDWSVGIRI